MDAIECRILAEIMLCEDYDREPANLEYLYKETGIRKHILVTYLRKMEGTGLIERTRGPTGIIYTNSYIETEPLG